MVFSSEAYEKAFPRKSEPVGSVMQPIKPEASKPGNVLEEADKVTEPSKAPEIETPDPEPIDETGGGASDGD